MSPRPSDLRLDRVVLPTAKASGRSAPEGHRAVGAWRGTRSGVGTSILGRPRPLPGHRRADPHYTLNCEEPLRPSAEDSVVASATNGIPAAFAKMVGDEERYADWFESQLDAIDSRGLLQVGKHAWPC
jgi:hypothetical protein